MLEHVFNYLPISETLATAGQPSTEQFADIRQAGFEVVINLAMPTSSNALLDERSVVETHGMIYYSIPVLWEQPTQADFQKFQALLAAHAGQKVLVHCAMNMRVSTFVYLHRHLQGVSPVEAKAAMTKIWQPNETLQRFIDDTLAQSTSA